MIIINYWANPMNYISAKPYEFKYSLGSIDKFIVKFEKF